MPKQPQAQIAQALDSARAALGSEPEPVDKATLQHAINLLQRVYDKNRGEGGGSTKQARTAPRSYAEIASNATKS